MRKSPDHALVLLSGGQDSVTVLGITLKAYSKVSAISFNYNQRHAVELKAAASICRRHAVPHHVVDLGPLLASLVISALTGDGDTSAPHPTKPGLPASFVPGRNALFITLAHAHAQTIGAARIMMGMCETDYSGYPDCRKQFIDVIQDALNCGYETRIQFHTPLMYLDKAATFLAAYSAEFLDEVIQFSHTCYNGDHTTRHEWGYGCGECPACKLRAAGWAKFKAAHPELAAPYVPFRFKS